MLDKYVVKDGADQNILVFDGDQKPGDGIFTDRHAALLRTVARYNRLGDIEAIYVPEEIEVEGENGNACGMYIIPDKRLNLGGELLKYYLEETGHGTTLFIRNPRRTPADPPASVDRYLVVAIGQPNTVLLGSVP